ncbi:hypothetical protein [Mycobacterium xenopi]|uniref:hypothetical protein n=1 Tax=Mycobacterium xenopi TaxID=1789 RepID=UPI001B802037|nr:hypothetical protein [Mycobacterium xenopi]
MDGGPGGCRLAGGDGAGVGQVGMGVSVCDGCGRAAGLRRRIGWRLFDVVGLGAGLGVWVDDEGMADLGDGELFVSAINWVATFIAAATIAAHQHRSTETRLMNQPILARSVGLGGERLARLVRLAVLAGAQSARWLSVLVMCSSW